MFYYTAFFTIITATYNAAATLPRLLESLAAQTCRDFIWVVQDGASTDETRDIIEAWRDRLPAILAASGPDSGIYDAWNKALERTAGQLGQWVLFLGADDLLAGPEVLAKAKARLAAQPDEVILGAGDMVSFYPDGTMDKAVTPDIAWAFGRLPVRAMPLAHPALFASRRVVLEQRFDAAFRIVGDYEWLRRVWQREQQAISLGFVVTRMCSGGVSSNPRYASIVRAEDRKVWRRYPPRALGMWPTYCYVYVESLLHPTKMRIKAWAHALPWTDRLWRRLRQWRKARIENRPHIR